MSARSPITTHVLDVSLGRPASGVPVRLSRVSGGEDVELARASTDADGRAGALLPPGPIEPGTYRISFDVAAYFAASVVRPDGPGDGASGAGAGRASFYPYVDVVFRVEAEREHYHVPLLLSPFGYSTYRGS